MNKRDKITKLPHYCDREQITETPTGTNYGTACLYYTVNWKKDTVEDICLYNHEIIRVSKRKTKFFHIKTFFYYLFKFNLVEWFFTGFPSTEGPVSFCKCPENCYKISKTLMRKKKLKKLENVKIK